MTPPSGYHQDADGTWWQYSQNRRTRAVERACPQCGKSFVRMPQTTFQWCSTICRARTAPIRCSTRVDLFEHWTPDEAWLAGLIWSDGSITKMYNGFQVYLGSSDEELTAAAASIAGTKYRTREGNRGLGKKLEHYMSFAAAIVVDRLVAAGLRPRKSLTGAWPTIPERVHAPFIRGVFDGDGTVGIYKNPSVKDAAHEGRLMSGFSGPPDFLAGLQSVLVANVGTTPKTLIRNGTIRSLTYNHAESLAVAAYMYADGGPRLGRKAEIFARGAQLDPRRHPLPQPWPEVLMAA